MSTSIFPDLDVPSGGRVSTHAAGAMAVHACIRPGNRVWTPEIPDRRSFNLAMI